MLIIRTLLIWSRKELSVSARSNKYSETVFSTSSIFFPTRSFICSPLRTRRASFPLE